jgi:hypothetical protein
LPLFCGALCNLHAPFWRHALGTRRATILAKCFRGRAVAKVAGAQLPNFDQYIDTITEAGQGLQS